MYFNLNIPRILVLLVTLNSCFILTKQLKATSFDSTQKNTSELIAFSQEQPEEINYARIVEKIDSIAQQITVKIDNITNQSNGSGVIIAHQGNTYYVLTAKHILCTNLNKPECEANGQHQIVTPDGKIHKMDSQTVQVPAAGIDLAIVKFTSDRAYTIATLGDYNWGNQWVFISGFANHEQPKNSKINCILTAGKVFSKEQADFVVKDVSSLQGGNQLVYTNSTYPGMGGGAVLDSQGRLIGIHTGTESEVDIDKERNFNQQNLGYSLGIPIKTLLSFLDRTQLQPQWLQIETTTKSPINSSKTTAIAILG